MECTELFDVIFEKFERKVKIAGSEYVWDHLNRRGDNFLTKGSVLRY